MNLGVFYKMADLKDNFREWLIQQGAKPGTITSYLSDQLWQKQIWKIIIHQKIKFNNLYI